MIAIILAVWLVLGAALLGTFLAGDIGNTDISTTRLILIILIGGPTVWSFTLAMLFVLGIKKLLKDEV